MMCGQHWRSGEEGLRMLTDGTISGGERDFWARSLAQTV